MTFSPFSIGQAITIATQKFIQVKVENPRYEARLLMQHCIDKDLAFLISHNSKILERVHQEKFFEWVQRRELGEPIAYIVGETGFWNLALYCDNSTLIPRDDTETLVEWALSLPVPDNASVLDLGTGTGAIALALASQKKEWSVVGVDKVQEAVELATRNAQRNQLDVVFNCSDWFSSLAQRKFDLIVCNPPYVESNSPYLQRGDLRYEPSTALVSLNEGMADIITIINTATRHLNHNGWLLIEHSNEQAIKVQSVLKQNEYIQINTRKDLNQLDRVSGGCYKAH